MTTIGETTETRLGKIAALSFGLHDGKFGALFTLGGEGWGVQNLWGAWAGEPGRYAKWTTKDQGDIYIDVCRRLIKLLEDAGVQDVTQLVGVPIEAEITRGGTLKSWRILTEVL